jgi:hypothetical protein
MTNAAAVTGDDTNSTNINIINKGSAGAGTAEIGNLDLATGTDLVDFDEKAVTFNATYTTGVTLSEGDVLVVEFEKVNTGLLLTNPTFRICYHAI